ncbi:MAG: DUF881 domain-containing protein [Actinobacteria bacterium]|nr:DUF881 domain-containing protein [Actinomycetota bacterium]MCA1721348.1 DUF881 domain-containing protein [Actinomycetota bacterium]
MTPPPVDQRADRSMSLLTDLTGTSLDSSYAEAAARRGTGAEPPSRRAIAVVLLLALGALTGTAAAQVRHRQAAQAGVRAQLVADVQQRTGATDELARTASRLRADVAGMQAKGLSSGAAGRAAAEQLAALELAAAVAPVTGPGVVVRLDDAPLPDDGSPRPDDARVQDRDLQDVANALWAAGAEAVSINGLRLTAQTAIRSAGEAVLVDFRPLTTPYTVRAVGNPKLLEPGFVDGPAGRRLATLTSVYGIRFEVSRTDRQTLAGSGSPSLRLARP